MTDTSHDKTYHHKIEAECLAHDRAIEAAKVAVQSAIHEIYTTQEPGFINCRDSIATAAIEAYNAAMGEAREWKPIETAPKDGTHILLYAPPGQTAEPRITLGCWLALERGEYLGDCGGECRCPEYDDPPEPYWDSFDGGFNSEFPPTHWMPCPQPPKDNGHE
jgi:hypothetical protein